MRPLELFPLPQFTPLALMNALETIPNRTRRVVSKTLVCASNVTRLCGLLACTVFLLPLAHAQDTWTASTLRVQTNSLNAAAFGGGIWVASGDNQTLLTSTDGSVWTPRNPGTNASLTGVAYGTGKFVVVGAGGTILTSSDGIIWTARTSGTTKLLRGITFAGNQFVAVGNEGAVLTSPDGIAWTVRFSGPPGSTGSNLSQALYGVAFSGGLYVASGSLGTIITSTDGITWLTQSSGTTVELTGVAYGNGRFLAVGDSGVVRESTNGTSWTGVAVTWALNDGSPIIVSLEAVSFGGGRFVVAGHGGVILAGAVGAGGSLQAAELGEGLNMENFNGVGYDGTRFVVVGQVGATVASTNGVDWTGMPPITVSTLQGVAASGPIAFAVGANTYGGTTYVSADGLAWTGRQHYASFRAAAYGGGVYVAVGSEVATSTNGRVWTGRSLPFGQFIPQLRGIVHGGGQFVAVGNSGQIFTSPTGETWTERVSNTAMALNGIAHANGLYVAVGDFNASGAPATILTSSNGTSWISRNSGLTGSNLLSAAFGGGIFVAVGSNGALTTSPDGVTWTPRTPVSSANLNSVIYATGRFTAVGDNGVVFVSTDGTAWSPRTSSTSANLRGIALQDSSLLAVGSGDVLAKSVSTLNVAPVITTQPTSVTVTAGLNVQFGFGASGIPNPTLQWQRSTDGGTTWADLSNGFPYSGVTSGTLTIFGVDTTRSGDRFRGVATNLLGSATSLPAVLTVTDPINPVILNSPANQVVNVGQTATFIVSSIGAAPLTYQWQRLSAGSGTWNNLSTGGNYGGAGSATLTVNNAALSMSGDQFRCIVSNPFGNATSGVGLLTVNPPPVAPTIVTDPSAQTATAGLGATFGVSAAGTAPLSYVWQRLPAGAGVWSNLSTTSVYSGVSTATLTLSTTTTAMSGDQFRCVVSNSQGSVNSLPAVLTVSLPNQTPSFTSHPANLTANSTGSATFSVVVSGNPTPTLVWQISTNAGTSWQAVPGATGTSLTLTNLALSQNGHRYRVVATNPISTATSNAATLTVNELILPTVVTLPPLGGEFREGQALSLSVTVTGSPPFSYRWFRNGLLLSGASSSSYAIASIALGDAGSYHVEVTGRGGMAATNGTAVTVISLPRFTGQPVNAVVESGLNAAFAVTVVGDPAPTLQWFRRMGAGAWAPIANAPPFSGGTTRILSINGAGTDLDGLQVQARATNAGGTTESATATLGVGVSGPGLRILVQPQSQVVAAGRAVTLSVVPEGTQPFTYQWRKDGASLPSGALGILQIASASSTDAGGYSVVVRDANGLSVSSNSAYLSVAGAVDPAFNPQGGPDGEITQMISLADGGYLVAGSFDRFAGLPRKGLVRLRSDGTADPSFDPGTGANGPVQAMLELSGGRFLVVGQFGQFNSSAVAGLVRLNAAGSVDPGFAPVMPTSPVSGSPVPVLERFHYAVIGLNGGGYLFGGKAGIVGVSETGQINPQAVLFTNGGVFALMQQFNGGILAGGDFTLINGFVRPRLSRISPTYQVDLTFDVGSGPNATVNSLLRSPDGAIYVLGKFNQFNGRARPAGIARIGPTGTLDLGFNPALAPLTAGTDSSSIAAGSIQPAAGRLDAIRAGQVRPNGGLAVSDGSGLNQSVVALSPAGAIESEVSVPVQGAANALAISANEDVVVGGQFSAIAGTNRNSVGAFSDAGEGSRLTNLSCRSRVVGNSSILILGFVIEGPESMRVLIRGVGPTLRAFNITDALNRPLLTLFNSAGQPIAENRGWRAVPDPDGLARSMRQVGAFDLGSEDDTAVLLNLPPGSYTAHISGQAGSTGVALGEIYAVDQGQSRLINSSVRGPVGTGENILIPGFSISGVARLTLIRAAGPGLDQFGVPDTLDRPSMTLRRDGVTLAGNQGWTTGFDPSAVQARAALVGAFPFSVQSADAAVLVSLEPGGYTVAVSGTDGGTGAALVEVYDANGIQRTPTNQ